ncbi:MAG TPA: AraC family transcriptional regulator [Puia sp.]|nr:AraC family transcriptional regulator [Puia sp.]
MNQKDIGLLHQIREFILDNLHRPIPVTLICKHFAINKTKLQEQFRECFGTSLHAFILQRRLDKSVILLRETDEPVKYIAGICGYKKVRSFNKAFKGRWHLSPDQFRKNKWTVSQGAGAAKSNTNAAKSYTL